MKDTDENIGQSQQYLQQWNDALFLHWEVGLDVLQKFVPPQLQIESLQGKAWVSVVAFRMEVLKHGLLPVFPPLTRFTEINVRTYVRYKNVSGVYFLSIEGGTWVSCTMARFLSGLPYRYSKMRRTPVGYESHNKKRGDRLKVSFSPGSPIHEKTGHDVWLTERYALFQESPDTLDSFRITHPEWPLRQVDLKKVDICYPRLQSLLSNSPDLAHYSSGVEVVAGARERHKIARSI